MPIMGKINDKKIQTLRIVFPGGYNDELSLGELSQKGWVGPLAVWTDALTCYEVDFIELDRLAVDIKYKTKYGIPCFTEPGLIVVESLSYESIVNSLKYLVKDGFFEHLVPRSMPEVCTGISLSVQVA